MLSRGKTGTFVGAFNKEMPLVGARDFLWAVVKPREVSLPALLLAAVPHESGQQACDTMSDGRGGYISPCDSAGDWAFTTPRITQVQENIALQKTHTSIVFVTYRISMCLNVSRFQVSRLILIPSLHKSPGSAAPPELLLWVRVC